MNKKQAVSFLKNYRYVKSGYQHCADRLIELEALITSARSMPSSAVPNRGGSNKYEDALVERLMKKQQAAEQCERLAAKLREYDRCLELLTDAEKTVVRGFFISPPESVSPTEYLCDSLGYEKSHIYRIRERALLKLLTYFNQRMAV